MWVGGYSLYARRGSDMTAYMCKTRLSSAYMCVCVLFCMQFIISYLMHSLLYNGCNENSNVYELKVGIGKSYIYMHAKKKKKKKKT